MPSSISSRQNRASSPPLSASSLAYTASNQPKLNIVTRLAVEGKAKQSQDGASIKVYMKISLPLDVVNPGSIIPLFPEENIKIMASQVHPIDNNSIPYNFSSAASPLLHNAARALSLPARSSESYLSKFGLAMSSPSIDSSSRSSSSSNTLNLPPLDVKYTGQILVSGYNVSYALPKELPPRSKPDTDTEVDNYSRSTPYSSRNRRGSVVDKNSFQFMIAIDMWIPFVLRPPRAPYLLSIPLPRCLSNQIKLRIFPPANTSSSFASLSSAEEDGTWDLTSDPHVTRTTSHRLSRNNSYQHFADDESSDSSTAGFPEGCGIHGTFPSTERIRVRWATPMRSLNIPDGNDGRRRVGVKKVQGEMSCSILGKAASKNGGPEGVVMSVEYKGSCKGVWFPGVATLLGMDVGLEAKGSEVSWVPGMEQKWSVNGGSGYTGFDIGAAPDPLSRQSSMDSSQMPEPPHLNGTSDHTPTISNQNSASSSTSSLIRAPLPVPNVMEYSFEGSSSVLSNTVSSISSLTPASTPAKDGRSRAQSLNAPAVNSRPPGSPITIHVNMNDLLPPSKNVLTFNISGTILVRPRLRPYGMNSRSSSPAGSDTEGGDPEPIVLPRFTVLAADSETITTLIRNDAEDSIVKVYNSSGDLRDAQTRKTVLQKAGFTKCGDQGGRIALRSLKSSAFPSRRPGPLAEMSGRLPVSRPQTPNGIHRMPSSSSLRQPSAISVRSKRSGALVIPYVLATVTPLPKLGEVLPNAYAVRVTVPAPADADSEWFEFGLTQTSSASSSSKEAPPEDGSDRRLVEILGVSVDGVPARFETTASSGGATNGYAGLDAPIDGMHASEWISWVRMNVGSSGGALVLVDYLISMEDAAKRKKKGKRKTNQLHVLLPSFALPVSRLEVLVENVSGVHISPSRSNLHYQPCLHTGCRFIHPSLDELFQPQLSLEISSTTDSRSSLFAINLLRFLAWAVPTLLCLFLFSQSLTFGTHLRDMKSSVENCSSAVASGIRNQPDTVTVTNTVFTSSQSKWWFGEVLTTTPVPSPLDSSPSPRPDPSHTISVSTPLSTDPVPSSPPEEKFALLPIDNFPFPWPLRIDVPLAARVTFSKVKDGLITVWQIFRRVYHYPLDPT